MQPRSLRFALLAIAAATCGCERATPSDPRADAQAAMVIRTALTSGSVGGDGSAAEAQPVGTGWATLKGQFLFDGTIPARKPLLVNKETNICAPGGKVVLNQVLLVDSSNKGIANVTIFLRKANRVHPSAAPDDQEVLFDQKECIFLSHVLAMKVGQKLKILNSDPIGHNTKIEFKKSAAFNQSVPDGQSLIYVPPKEESFPVSVACSIHPWMQAYLLPRDNGYFAVTATDGSFEIPNVPAGEELEFQVWHEDAKGSGGGLVVDTPKAKALKWSKKGRFKVTLEEDQELEIALNVPASAFRD